MSAGVTPENKGADETLSARQRDILKVLVQEYIASATPVGSGTLRRIGNLDVSSATIRNELGMLEERGYVAQPHTSAGRTPTVKGYRYFVEQLMEQVELSAPEQRTIRHQFYQVTLNLDQWMRLTAAVLAHTVRAASLVTPPHVAQSRFKHLELISIHDTLCLLVVVLHGGSIHQDMLVLDSAMPQEQLSHASNRLNELLRDRTLDEIDTAGSAGAPEPPEWERQVLQRVMQLMRQADRQAISEVYRDGLVNVMRQPEFDDAERSRQVIEILEHRNVLEAILAKTLNANGVQIIIGGEGAYEEIDDVSLVLSPYGVKGKASGVLGIMGPTRMAYGRAISAVRYVAQIMNDLIVDVYGD